jgi:hypothetical protein
MSNKSIQATGNRLTVLVLGAAVLALLAGAEVQPQGRAGVPAVAGAEPGDLAWG